MPRGKSENSNTLKLRDFLYEVWRIIVRAAAPREGRVCVLKCVRVVDGMDSRARTHTHIGVEPQTETMCMLAEGVEACSSTIKAAGVTSEQKKHCVYLGGEMCEDGTWHQG